MGTFQGHMNQQWPWEVMEIRILNRKIFLKLIQKDFSISMPKGQVRRDLQVSTSHRERSQVKFFYISLQKDKKILHIHQYPLTISCINKIKKKNHFLEWARQILCKHTTKALSSLQSIWKLNRLWVHRTLVFLIWRRNNTNKKLHLWLRNWQKIVCKRENSCSKWASFQGKTKSWKIRINFWRKKRGFWVVQAISSASSRMKRSSINKKSINGRKATKS